MIADRTSRANTKVAAVSAVDPSSTRQNGLFNGLIWPKDSFASSA